ncbi:MAG: chemotaxis protein CheX [Epsilonproteobacteria bacterium]|nr:chemotaxis protein CheX [Campylobacterota bacterium]
MFSILKEASKNFADSIGAELSECKKDDLRGYVSKIDIDGDKNLSIYLVLPKEKLDKVSEAFFGEIDYEPNDLANEIANLIIGNSKVVAEKYNIKYNISVPEFLGEYHGIEYDEILCFAMDGVDFYILLKAK